MAREEKGGKCEDNINGSRDCKRTVMKKGGIYATGSDINLIPDPKTCEVRVVGIVADSDRDWVNDQIKEVYSRCKKGFHQ